MRISRWQWTAGIWVVLQSAWAWATPTNEDILRSFNENMDQAPDYSRLIPWLLAVAGIVVVVIFFRQRQKRQAVPKILNHPRKLMREMVKAVDLDAGEMKALSRRAKELDCQSALTLLLCPSLTQGGGENSDSGADSEASAVG